MDHRRPGIWQVLDVVRANDRQEGGSHYKAGAIPCPHCGEGIEHWDLAWKASWDMFMYMITKHLFRWQRKGGIQDLRKAHHELGKYIEVLEEEQNAANAGPGYVDQD